MTGVALGVEVGVELDWVDVLEVTVAGFDLAIYITPPEMTTTKISKMMTITQGNRLLDSEMGDRTGNGGVGDGVEEVA